MYGVQHCRKSSVIVHSPAGFQVSGVAGSGHARLRCATASLAGLPALVELGLNPLYLIEREKAHLNHLFVSSFSVRPTSETRPPYVSILVSHRTTPRALGDDPPQNHMASTFCFSRCRMASFIDRRSRAATQTTPVHEETVNTSLPVSEWVAVGLPACARYVMNSLPSVGTWSGRP